jgi:general secretion pathway protein G
MDTLMKTRKIFYVICNKQWVYKALIGNAHIRHRSAHDNEGFTLIELIVVVALVAILATLSLIAGGNLKNTAKNGRAKSEIRTHEKAIIASYTDRGQLPNLLSDIVSAANINDPWGRPYQYRNIGNNSGSSPNRYVDFTGANLNEQFDLYSMGQNGASSQNLSPTAPVPNTSKDDIVYCNDGTTVEVGLER